MGTLGKKNMLQKQPRNCPVCCEIIPQNELVGRTKYHEECAAILKRVKDIARLKFQFWLYKTKRDWTPSRHEIRYKRELIIQETAKNIVDKANNNEYLIGLVISYFWRLFSKRGQVVRLK